MCVCVWWWWCAQAEQGFEPWFYYVLATSLHTLKRIIADWTATRRCHHIDMNISWLQLITKPNVTRIFAIVALHVYVWDRMCFGIGNIGRQQSPLIWMCNHLLINVNFNWIEVMNEKFKRIEFRMQIDTHYVLNAFQICVIKYWKWHLAIMCCQ